MRAVAKIESLGFVDESYGNDTCPKMTFDAGCFRVVMFIDAIDPDMRDEGGESQFQAALYTCNLDGTEHESFWCDGYEDLENAYRSFQRTFPKCTIPSFNNTGETK